MPQPKPKKSQPSFLVEPHNLDEATKAELLTLLGHREFDRAGAEFAPLAETMRHQFPGHKVIKAGNDAPWLLERDLNRSTTPAGRDVFLAIHDVEAVLGLGISGTNHLDSVPRAADYREAFRPVGRTVSDLQEMIKRLTKSGYYLEQFKRNGADILEIEKALASLAAVSAAVLNEFKSKSSMGARRHTALTEVIRRLRAIFREHYQGKRTERKRRGAFQFQAAWEQRELKFVETALRAARMLRVGDAELRRLFRDSRCTPGEPKRKKP